ncbi:hypothetical protein B0T19DRAFT_295106 [Cercophora scortea]|uniref:Uncharacterized protein n=1 Tax=Cercophora scortea TaxID=314031 RepID=A0AAE0I4U9_9PEZI|nr:hypothetical protein B0T19DRAFT_295106 [Cercophora scortea]
MAESHSERFDVHWSNRFVPVTGGLLGLLIHVCYSLERWRFFFPLTLLLLPKAVIGCVLLMFLTPCRFPSLRLNSSFPQAENLNYRTPSTLSVFVQNLGLIMRFLGNQRPRS